MISLRISIDDRATPAISSLAARLTDLRPLNAALGGRLERTLQDHFTQREGEKNKKNWPKTHFWAHVQSGTQLTSVSQLGATVTIAHPAIRQKVYGGDITPKPPRRALAIPAIAQAYGTSPLELGDSANLKFVPFKRPGGKLVGALFQDKTVWFWLVSSVSQAADPRALPASAALTSAMEDQANRFAQIAARGTGAA